MQAPHICLASALLALTAIVTYRPTAELQFVRADTNQEALCSIKILNEQQVPVAYKVRTTHPKNYRVKQGRGILQPSHSEVVNVILLSGNLTNGSPTVFS